MVGIHIVRTIVCEREKMDVYVITIKIQVKVIAPDLAYRIVEEFEDNRRWPKTLTFKWRLRGSGYHRSGASCPMPAEARPGSSLETLVRPFLLSVSANCEADGTWNSGTL
jgi:hypothetical protein